jgi:hypothetical protein
MTLKASTLKENTNMIEDVGKESLSILMEIYMKETFRVMNFMVLES